MIIQFCKLVFICLFFAFSYLHAQETIEIKKSNAESQLAKQILGLTGSNGGLCIHLGCGKN